MIDYKQGRKFAEIAQEVSLTLLKKESLSKEEKVQLIASAEAQVFLLSKVAGGMHLARAHWLAARSFYRLNEGNLAFMHAQFCEFLTKSALDRTKLDEAFSLDILGRSLQLKGQDIEGQKCLVEALKIVDKITEAPDINYFREYLQEVTKEKGI